MFAKNFNEIKTVVNLSFNQSSDFVNILFSYTFNVPASYIDKGNDFDEEFMKIKHDLSGQISSGAANDKLCEVCLTPIVKGEKFCKNCGRSSTRQKTESVKEDLGIDVQFDENKIPFGQKVVDDILYGGIPKNSVVLITSPACEEKDLIVTRFIETGLDESEVVVNISTDERITDSQKISASSNFYHVSCNPQSETITNDTTNCNEIKVKGVERLTELSVALTSLLNNISKNQEHDSKQKRLVLEILSDTLLCNQSVNTRKWLRETITKFKNKNFTILAILNPYMHSKEETHALLDLFDGQMDLYEKESQGTSTMCLRIKRMSNSNYSSKEIVLQREDLLIQKDKEN